MFLMLHIILNEATKKAVQKNISWSLFAHWAVAQQLSCLNAPIHSAWTVGNP